MAAVRVAVIRAPGINCDRETLHAWRLVGAEPQLVHVRALIEQPSLLDRVQVVTVPGGFSFGDDLGAGKILADQLRRRLGDSLRSCVERGGLLLGICNGFQVLVKAGLLPGGDWGCDRVSITTNASARFEDRWVHMRPVADHCAVLRGIRSLYLPVAHGEGRVVTANEASRQRLHTGGHVALRYVDESGQAADYPANPNGSVDDIAALTDETGRAFGLMPHPERHVDRTHHPLWTRRPADLEPDGLALFRNAVAHFN